jgi:formate-nitrite transporter family protein
MVSPMSSRLVEPLTARDHVRGPTAAAVSLLEYGDFECPYCRSAVEIVNGLQQALGDQLAFAFRHFPMREAHPHAQHAAEVAEAAAAQGRFWDMHDRLFAGQDALDDARLVRYARELSLDWERVRDGLASHSHAARIERDQQSGSASGVASTPTFFIDGIRYDGSVSLPRMLAAIRELHPEIAVSEPLPNAPRIPRVRWPREST